MTAAPGPRSRRPRSAANYGPQRGTTYLIHIDPPYKHAKHYKGWTDRPVAQRFADHLAGRGALLTRLAVQAGSRLTLSRVWPNTTKDREDAIKRSGGKRMCPECGVTPGHTRLASDKAPEPDDRRPRWQYDRDGEWADDGTPIIYDPDQTYAQARAEAARHPVPEPDPAGQAELAALDELQRQWTSKEDQVGLKDDLKAGLKIVTEEVTFAAWAMTKGRRLVAREEREQRRAHAEADRLSAIADELDRQMGRQAGYQHELTAERAARIRARLGEDLVQDARLEAMPRAEGQPLEHWAITPDDVAQTPREPVLQGADLDAEIDRLAAQFAEPEPGLGPQPDGTYADTGPDAEEAEQDLIYEEGEPEAYQADEGAEPDPDWDALDEAAAYAAQGEENYKGPFFDAEQLAGPQPDLSAEEIQAFAQAARERWAQVDRYTEYMARQAVQYYGPAMADLLGIDPGDGVQGPGPEPGDDAATWSPALEGADPDAEVSDFPYLTERPAEPAPEPGDGALRDRAAYAEAVRQAEARALARQHIAQEEHDAAGVAAAREEANAARQARLATQAEAYEAATALQEDAAQADQEQAEGDPGPAAPSEGDLWDLEAGRAREHLGRWTAEHGPDGGYAESLRQDVARYEQWAGEARASARPAADRIPPEGGRRGAPVAATQPDGTPHTDPALAERGWQADSHGVNTRNPDAEAPGAHCGLAGYEADSPDHQYGSPQCAEADPEGAHFGRGPGEPVDTGRWPVLQADYGRMYIGPQAQAEAV